MSKYLLIIFSIFATSLFLSSPVFATSAYDSIVQPLKPLTGICPADLYTNLSTYVHAIPNVTTENLALFDSVYTAEKGYSLSQYQNSSGDFLGSFLLTMTSDTTPTTTWASTSITMNNAKSIRFGCYNSTGTMSLTYQESSNSTVMWVSTNWRPVVFAGVITYPTGYAGLTIPTIEPPTNQNYDDLLDTIVTTDIFNYFDQNVGGTQYTCGDSVTNYKYSWGALVENNPTYASQATSDLIASFRSAVRGNGAWAVVPYVHEDAIDDPIHPAFLLVWTEDRTQWHSDFYYNETSLLQEIRWVRNSGVSSDVHLSYAFIGSTSGIQNTTTGNCEPEFLWGASDQFDGFEISKNSEYYQLFLSNFSAEYPDGYAGSLVPDSVTEPVPLPVIKPEFSYSVVNKKITATDVIQELPVYPSSSDWIVGDYWVEWSLMWCNPYNETTKTCSNPEVEDYQQLPLGSDYMADIDSLDGYTLSATYLIELCSTTTQGYCIRIAPDVGEGSIVDYDFLSTTIYLDIDGTSFTGDTTELVCDVSGFCYVAVVDCSLETGFFAQMNCEMQDKFSIGLLNPSINAFKLLFSSMIVPSAPTCSIPIGDVVLATGYTFPLSGYDNAVCDTSDTLKDAFPLSSLLVNFVLALSVLFLIIRIINRMTDHNETNLIDGIN